MASNCAHSPALAGTLIVYAKTQPEAGSQGITAFIIERGMKVGCGLSLLLLRQLDQNHAAA